MSVENSRAYRRLLLFAFIGFLFLAQSVRTSLGATTPERNPNLDALVIENAPTKVSNVLIDLESFRSDIAEQDRVQQDDRLFSPRFGELFEREPYEGTAAEDSALYALKDPTDSTQSNPQAPSAFGAAPPPPKDWVSTVPLSSGEKFKIFLHSSFFPPRPYLLSLLSGFFNQSVTHIDNPKPHRTEGDYVADSLTRAARSFAFRATANFFEKFAYASMFKQDPRYHRSGKQGFKARVLYAVTRVFITQGDRMSQQVNISFFAGGLSTAAMSNLWERPEHQTIGGTFSRFASHIGFTALSNVLIEFTGGQ